MEETIMPIKQTMRSEVPNEETLHFLFLGEMGPVFEFIQTLRRVYSNKILATENKHEGLVIENVTVWESEAALNEFNEQLHQAFPTFWKVREQYHKDHNIKWSVTFETIE